MAEIPVLVTGLVLTRSENRPPMFLGRKREGRPCKGDPVLEDIGGCHLVQFWVKWQEGRSSRLEVDVVEKRSKCHYGGRNKRLPTKWIVIEMTMATGWALSTEMESIDAVKDRAETNPPFPCLATEQRRNARVRRPVGWPTEGNDASPALLTFGQHSSSAYSSVCSSIGNRISMSVHKKHQLLVPPSTTRVGNLLALFSIGGSRYIFQLSFLHTGIQSSLINCIL